MNYDILFAIVFYLAIFIFFLNKRERFQVQGKIFALYRTSLGIHLMDKIANLSKRFWRVLGLLSIATGFGGMAFIFFWLIKGTIELIFVPEAMPAVAPVLPGIKVMPGLPVLSFWHWIISIFIVAVVHEFCHGIYSRVYDTKIKSSGFAFLGPILAAFVEPDEKQLAKKKSRVQLAVFSAGPFSNIVLGLIFIAILNFASSPIYQKVFQGDGITVGKVEADYPAAKAGMQAPFTITSVNREQTLELKAFINATKDLKPGDVVSLETDKGKYDIKTVENPKNASRAFIGISSLDLKIKTRERIIQKYGAFLPQLFAWFHMLIFWLVVVNIGVGLFNLLPLGPVDGGRMFLTLSLAIFKKPEKAKKFWTSITFFCLLLIFINMLPYLWKLILFVIKPVTLLFGV